MRISDWSSDVCSSDLPAGSVLRLVDELVLGDPRHHRAQFGADLFDRVFGGEFAGGLHFRLAGAVVEHETADEADLQIGNASCRDSVCQSVYISVVAVSLIITIYISLYNIYILL